MWLLLACTSTGPDSPSDVSGDSPVESARDSAADSQDSGVEWPDDAWALDDVTVVDASGSRPGQAVIVVGDLIWDVVDANQDWPAAWQVVDQGGFVVPGLTDSHVHLAYSGAYGWVGDTVEENLAAQLAWGVTGVVDAGGPTWTWSLRDRVDAGELVGPRMRAAGPFLTAIGSHPCELSNDRGLCVFVDDGAAQAQEHRDGGADLVKVALSETGIDTTWPRLDLGDLADITSTGETLVHVGSAQDLRDALDQGAEHVAHTPFADDIAVEDADGAASIASTVGASGLARIRSHDLDDPQFSHVPDEVLANWLTAQGASYAAWAAVDQAFADQTRANLAVLVGEAPVVAGSDAGYWFVPHGLGLHWELEELVAAGMTPLEALTAATALPAQVWGWDDAGFVDAGYRADLVLLTADPLEDIANTRAIAQVWLAGEPVGDVWQAQGGTFCLDDRDCGQGRCDLVDHACVEACDTPYATSGACDEDSWCMPQDALATTAEGVCHVEPRCDWKAQDCAPAYYGETCVPADTDTSYCWPSGDRQQGQTCDYGSRLCEQGHFCSTITWRCYELCDPDAPSCAVGTCHQEYAGGGEEWFGLCY